MVRHDGDGYDDVSRRAGAERRYSEATPVSRRRNDDASTEVRGQKLFERGRERERR